jgi:hypothetical protein
MTTQEILFDFCDQLLTQADHRMTKAEKLVSENNHEMAAQDATVSKLLLSLEMAVRETANSLFANMSQRFMEEMKPILKPIKCRDGSTLSVQASRYHYSKPRDDKGPYTHVEVGFLHHNQQIRGYHLLMEQVIQTFTATFRLSWCMNILTSMVELT